MGFEIESRIGSDGKRCALVPVSVILFCGILAGFVTGTGLAYGIAVLATLIVFIIFWLIPTRWFIWGSVFWAPMDIYRIELSPINFSPYRLFLLAAIVSWVMRSLLQLRELRFHRRFLTLFGLYALSTIAWAFFTRYDVVGIGEIVNIASGIMLILLFYAVLDSRDDWQRTVKIFIWSGAWILAGLGYTYILYFSTGRLVRDIPFRAAIPLELSDSGHLAQGHNVWGVPRLSLPFSSPPHLAGLIVALLSIVAAQLLFNRYSRRKRRWLLAYAGLLFGALILTFARSGWLGLAGGILVLVTKVFHSKNRRFLRRIFLLFLISFSLLGGIIFLTPERVTESLMSRFSLGPETDLGRHWETRLRALDIWSNGLGTMLFGVGMSNFLVYGQGVHSHSPYTTVLAERGLVGSVFFWMFYFGSSWWVLRRSISLWRRRDYEGYSMVFGVFAATVGVLFGSLFYEYIHRNVVWILFALAAATIRATGWEVSKQSEFGAPTAEA
jgi:hypothetical protein